jgi:DNA-directed RNA polymerase I, II, and III subunit RPABC2
MVGTSKYWLSTTFHGRIFGALLWKHATSSTMEADYSSDIGGFDEEEEPEVMDDVDQAEEPEDPNGQDADDNIVVTGDASAAAAAKDKANNTVESEKSKKVPDDQRTTTPYMTKYERARVLGTRALQIR